MTDRDLVGGLALALLVHKQLDGKSLLGEALLQPAAYEMQHRVQARKALTEFRDKRTGQAEVGAGHVRHNDDEAGWIPFRHIFQTLHPHAREIAILPGDGQPGRDALQVLDQA